MLDKLATTSAVIKALGGNQAVGELIGGGSPQQISNWNRQPQFPAHTYVVMTDALAKLGLTAPASLWKMTGIEGRDEKHPERAAS